MRGGSGGGQWRERENKGGEKRRRIWEGGGVGKEKRKEGTWGEEGQFVWAAVFTFNPYLLISINEIIDINNSFIDINKYGHSIHLY